MMRAEQEAARCKKNIKNSGTSLNFEIRAVQKKITFKPEIFPIIDLKIWLIFCN